MTRDAERAEVANQSRDLLVATTDLTLTQLGIPGVLACWRYLAERWRARVEPDAADSERQVPASRRRSRMPERWLVDLVVLALVGVLLMAAALAGLGAVSMRPPASGFIGGHAASAEALGLPGDPGCHHETE